MNVISIILIILFGSSLIAYSLGKVNGILRSVVSIIALLTAGVLFAAQYGITQHFSLTIAGFQLFLRINTIAWFFGMMVFVIAFVVLIYSLSYMKNRERLGYYCFALCISISSMIGIVMSADLLSFFFFWEMMTWSSFLMVIYYRFEAQKAGLKYFVMSLIGAYSMLMAIFIVYGQLGSLSFATLAAHWDTFPLYLQLAIFTLLAAGFGLKSAIMPLHTWAADAYEISPAPFTALFSGVLSKMGILGLVLLFYLFSAGTLANNFITINGVPAPGYIMAWLGAITALFGSFKAIMEDDAKRLLAFSSIGQLGYMIVGISISSTLGLSSALFMAVNHTIFKVMLFLAIGAVFLQTGTRKMSELGGLITRMPFTFFVVLLGIITLAGVPPLSGFVGKWMLYEALIEKKLVFLAVTALAASTAAFMYCYRLIYTIFLGQRPEKFDNLKEAPWPMVVPMVLLALLTIYLGVYPYHLFELISSMEQNLFGIIPLAVNDSALFSSLGSVNTYTVVTIIGIIFGTFFLVLTVLYPRSRKVGLKDIHTSGEVPGPEINLHYGINFYQPFSRGVRPLLKRSVSRFYSNIADGLESVFDLMRYIYTGNAQTYALYVIMFLALLLVFSKWLI